MVDIVTELGRYAKSLDKSNFVKERRHDAKGAPAASAVAGGYEIL